MSFLLDTSVFAEPARPAPAPRVLAWLRAQAPARLHLSVLTLGELQRGIERLTDGRRRRPLQAWIDTELPRLFAGRVLPVSDAVARDWGRLSALAEEGGRPLPLTDGLLLATALSHGLILVTRHAAECAGFGVPVLNPWTETPRP